MQQGTRRKRVGMGRGREEVETVIRLGVGSLFAAMGLSTNDSIWGLLLLF